MSGGKDRDQSIDRVLRRTRASGSASETRLSDACLDAETMAAWADGDLPAGERDAAEQHVAGCARCQAMLAALVRTTPEPAPARTWWRLSRAGWLIPLAATAAAVGIWIAVPEPPRTRPQESTTATPAPAASPPVATPAAKSPTPVVQPAPAVPRKAQPEAAALRAPAAAADTQTASNAAPPAATPEPPAVPPPAELRSAAQPAPQASREEAAPARSFQRVDSFSAKLEDARAVVEIASPDPMIRWRITGGRVVQRSVNGGSTWTTQPAAASSDLLAGASPSPSVCWLVGRGGLVLLTTDGRQWRPVAFPVSVDLSAVRATDARTAVITTSDGRTFRTSDAGQTWNP